MDKQNLIPQSAQPVKRIAARQIPPELAELLEEALQLKLQGEAISTSVPYSIIMMPIPCSHNGDDAE